MRALNFALVFFVAAVAAHEVESPRYFPPSTLSKDERSDANRQHWYSEELQALGERPLCCAAVSEQRVYRFTWLRSFHVPVAIRLEQSATGAWTIHTKVLSGAQDSRTSELLVNESRPIAAKAVAPVQELLKSDSSFWALPSVDESNYGLDGAQWIVEARDGERYHFVDRLSPKEGPIRELGLLFMNLYGRKLGKVY